VQAEARAFSAALGGEILGLVREKAIGLVEDEDLERRSPEFAQGYEVGEPPQGPTIISGLALSWQPVSRGACRRGGRRS